MKTFFFFLLPLCMTAQKNAVSEEIELINRTYGQLTELRTELDYVMYSNHTGAKEIDRQQAVLSRSGNSYLFEIGIIETLTTAAFTLVADHEDKELLFDKVRGKSQEKQFGINLDLALEACDTVFLSEPSPGIRQMVLELSMPDVEKVELRYDLKTRMMQKVILFYREKEEWEEGKPKTKARMEINYRKQNTHPVFAKDLFSIERFVQKDGGKYAPSPKFSNFTLYNQTDNQ